MADYRFVDRMYAYEYPRAAMVTDAVVFRFDGKQLQLLLVERGADPEKGKWALPGGFMNMDETVEECCRRELWEETDIRSVKTTEGLMTPYMKQIGTFSEIHRDPRGRVLSTAYYALVRSDYCRAGDDAAKAQWFSLSELPHMAFDHERIYRVAMQRLKEDIHFRPVAFELLDEKFTLPDLQRVYEQILGVSFDRRNMKKKLMSVGILIDCKEIQECHLHRGGHLYRLDRKAYALMKYKGQSEF